MPNDITVAKIHFRPGALTRDEIKELILSFAKQPADSGKLAYLRSHPNLQGLRALTREYSFAIKNEAVVEIIENPEPLENTTDLDELIVKIFTDLDKQVNRELIARATKEQQLTAKHVAFAEANLGKPGRSCDDYEHLFL